MNGAAWLLALATMGVDYGWRLDQKGQLEYIIQIPPSQLQTLQESPEGIVSNIPPELVRHVKRFRIVVGSETLPQDPLPAFSGESEFSNATPIKLGTARVSPVAGDLPLSDDDDFESTVTPLESLNAPRNALPGPGRDEAAEAVGEFLPIPPLPRAARIRDVEPLASTPAARPSLRREIASNGSFTPNTSAPDVGDTWNTSSTVALSNVGPPASLPRREVTPAWNGTTAVDGKQPPYAPLLFAVCALCLSIGGNVYLGWIAWGFYLKYRESFESWRSSHV
jgi:hypothetical protein